MKYKYQILWVICLIPVAWFMVLVWLQYFKPYHDGTEAEKLNKPLVKSKVLPPCAMPVSPNVAPPINCLPPHLANLPPDPGEAGKATVDGIDADKDPDGLRDDMQRWIAENWGHSPVAVQALTQWAQIRQTEVHYGDTLGKAETRKRFGAEMTRKATCFSFLETTEMLERGASDNLTKVALNTQERRQRSSDFDYMFAHGVSPAFEGTPAEACGFDPEALAAQAGERTITSQLIAERTERERLEPKEELREEEPK